MNPHPASSTWLPVYLGLALLLACSPASTSSRPLSAAETARNHYEIAMEDFDDGLYIEAVKKFNALKTKFPYSKYAALAELRIADSHFARDKFIEALDAYSLFIKFHPNHDQIPYARFRIGMCHFARIPTDYWFMPPSHEKDQRATRAALASVEDFLRAYPDTEYSDEAREMRDSCRQRLADHELYVAAFYADRGHPAAAAGRYQTVLERFPGLGLESEVLWNLARALRAAGKPDEARAALQRLVEEHPDADQAGPARSLLAETAEADPPPAPAR